MIVLKKSILVICLFALCAQASHETALSRWSSVCEVGNNIVKWKPTPYVIAPLASYAGMALGSHVAHAGGTLAYSLIAQDRYFAALAVATGTALGSFAAFTLPSAIPLVIMSKQRSLMNIKKREDKKPFWGPAAMQALCVGTPIAYLAYKQLPTISTGLLAQMFCCSIPGIIWGRIARNIEQDCGTLQKERIKNGMTSLHDKIGSLKVEVEALKKEQRARKDEELKKQQIYLNEQRTFFDAQRRRYPELEVWHTYGTRPLSVDDEDRWKMETELVLRRAQQAARDNLACNSPKPRLVSISKKFGIRAIEVKISKAPEQSIQLPSQINNPLHHYIAQVD